MLGQQGVPSDFREMVFRVELELDPPTFPEWNLPLSYSGQDLPHVELRCLKLDDYYVVTNVMFD